jgi:hypothetical protein
MKRLAVFKLSVSVFWLLLFRRRHGPRQRPGGGVVADMDQGQETPVVVHRRGVGVERGIGNSSVHSDGRSDNGQNNASVKSGGRSDAVRNERE